jgi:hypothetical protein
LSGWETPGDAFAAGVTEHRHLIAIRSVPQAKSKQKLRNSEVADLMTEK